MSKRRALITGITGQDGSYLAELLLTKGYDVHGIIRRTSMFNRHRIEDARARAVAAKQVYDLHYGDLGDSSSLNRIIAMTRTDGGQSLHPPAPVRALLAGPVSRLLPRIFVYGIRPERIAG